MLEVKLSFDSEEEVGKKLKIEWEPRQSYVERTCPTTEEDNKDEAKSSFESALKKVRPGDIITIPEKHMEIPETPAGVHLISVKDSVTCAVIRCP